MKHFYTLILMLFIAATSQAASTYSSVGIYMYDGSTHYVTMENGMTASLDGPALKFVSARGVITYPLDEVRHWTFSTEPGDANGWTGIDGTVSDQNSVKVVYTGTEITFYGMEKDSLISLYAIDGRLVRKVRCNGYASITIDLDSFSEGVYIVRYGSHSLKIAKK